MAKAKRVIKKYLIYDADRKAALRFVRKGVDQSGLSDTITIDTISANTAKIEDYNRDNKTDIGLKQAKYLNNSGSFVN